MPVVEGDVAGAIEPGVFQKVGAQFFQADETVEAADDLERVQKSLARRHFVERDHEIDASERLQGVAHIHSKSLSMSCHRQVAWRSRSSSAASFVQYANRGRLTTGPSVCR
jgi:hypothetical protein